MMGVQEEKVNKLKIVEWFKAVAQDNDQMIHDKEHLGLKIGDLQLQLAQKMEVVEETPRSNGTQDGLVNEVERLREEILLEKEQNDALMNEL